jgi:hypothetical protein
MALCWHEAGRVAGGAARNPACAHCLQDHAGEDPSQGCPRYRAVDAPRVVPSGALQVAGGAGNPRRAGARKLLQIKLHDIENSLRGTLRGFGLKVGKTTPKTFENRVRSLVAEHPSDVAGGQRRVVASPHGAGGAIQETGQPGPPGGPC